MNRRSAIKTVSVAVLGGIATMQMTSSWSKRHAKVFCKTIGKLPEGR